MVDLCKMDASQNGASSLASVILVENNSSVSIETDTVKDVTAGVAGSTTGSTKRTEDSAAVLATNRVRRRSTSSRSSRFRKSSRIASNVRRRSRRTSTRSSSLDRYYRCRGRYRRSRSRNRSRIRSHSRSRSRSISYRRRRRSSRTPSYRPPPRRRPFGRPRRFSPHFSRRGGRGGPTRRSPVVHHIRPSPVRARPRSSSPPPSTMQRSRPAKNSPPRAPMPPLSERFENIVKSTLRRGLREYGVQGGLAHLILTNRCKLPLPTLMREAKELSVVIERNLPSDITDPNAKISFNVDMGVKLLIPYPLGAGAKPVFDRPEIPVYKTADDEKKITEQIAAVLKAEQAENHTGYTNNRRGVIIPDRTQRPNRGSAFYRLGPLNPLEVPKGSAYFMHDDRDDPYQTGRGRNFRGGRRRRDDFNGYQSGRRGKTDRYASRSNRYSRNEGQWCHDKFLELEEGGDGDGLKNGLNKSSHNSSRSSPASSRHSENDKKM